MEANSRVFLFCSEARAAGPFFWQQGLEEHNSSKARCMTAKRPRAMTPPGVNLNLDPNLISRIQTPLAYALGLKLLGPKVLQARRANFL